MLGSGGKISIGMAAALLVGRYGELSEASDSVEGVKLFLSRACVVKVEVSKLWGGMAACAVSGVGGRVGKSLGAIVREES